MEIVFRFISQVFKLLLLLTVPAMAIPPQSELSVLSVNHAPQFLNYDDILDLIVAIDEDELDDKCTPEQIEKIAYFLSFLAKNGVGPDDPISCVSLDQDIDTLLCGIKNDVQFLSPYTAYSLEPAVYYEHPDTLLCKKWMSKQFHAVKKFVKKHKTAIIIGGAVVVGITLGVIAVAAFAGKTAACSAAATAVGAAASGLASDEQGDRPPISSQPTYQEIAKQPIDLIENIEQALPIFESPALTQVIQEKSNSLKATFAEEVLAEQLSPNASPSWSMAEKARQLGSAVAHEVLDGVATLGSVVPELQAEIIDVASKIVPQSYIPADLPEMINTDPVGSYNDIVLALHEGIDEVFSTNGAGRYTPEAKAKDPLNDFAIGIVPPPMLLGETFGTSKLVEAGRVFDRGGFTRAGRALMKHGNREGSVFPKPAGNVAHMNERGQMILEQILNHPERKITQWDHDVLGQVVDIEIPELGGVRFSGDGKKMIGFLEP